MGSIAKHVLVVGGNGFLGSAICRKALSLGFTVSSMSSSGQPFTTPKGHTPAWVKAVDWHKASAFEPDSYAHLLDKKSVVVHTMGTLLEGQYKESLRKGDINGISEAFLRAWGFGDTINPLDKSASGEYERMNRDSAFRVLESYLRAEPTDDMEEPQRTFVYISAEDIFRPWVPKRYIDTKREAERGIEWLCDKSKDIDQPVRSISARPGLMYHPHLRPLSTPLATLLEMSSNLHRSPPFNLPLPLPADIFRSLASRFDPMHHAEPSFSNESSDPEWMKDSPAASSSHVPPSPFMSIANLVELPPIHVDQVADAILAAVNDPFIQGPIGVDDMRALIGWTYSDQEPVQSAT